MASMTLMAALHSTSSTPLCPPAADCPACLQIALLENRARAQPNVARIPALDPKERTELGISAEPYDVAERGDPQNLLSEHSLAKFMYRAHDPMKLHREQERPGVWNPLYRYPSA